jgi:hypothetical protein
MIMMMMMVMMMMMNGIRHPNPDEFWLVKSQALLVKSTILLISSNF